jgi:hypothetical protein
MYQVVPPVVVLRKMIAEGGAMGIRTSPICGKLIAEGGEDKMTKKLVSQIIQCMDRIVPHFHISLLVNV